MADARARERDVVGWAKIALDRAGDAAARKSAHGALERFGHASWFDLTEGRVCAFGGRRRARDATERRGVVCAIDIGACADARAGGGGGGWEFV